MIPPSYAHAITVNTVVQAEYRWSSEDSSDSTLWVVAIGNKEITLGACKPGPELSPIYHQGVVPWDQGHLHTNEMFTTPGKRGHFPPSKGHWHIKILQVPVVTVRENKTFKIAPSTGKLKKSLYLSTWIKSKTVLTKKKKKKSSLPKTNRHRNNPLSTMNREGNSVEQKEIESLQEPNSKTWKIVVSHNNRDFNFAVIQKKSSWDIRKLRNAVQWAQE